MIFKMDNDKLFIIENGKIAMRIEKWKNYKKFYGGKIADIKVSNFPEFLEEFSSKYKKLFPEYFLVLNLGRFIGNKLDSSKYKILGRNFMEFKLKKIDENFYDDDILQLNFRSLKNYLKEIYEAKPWYDNLLMGVNTPEDLNEFFEIMINKEEFGRVLHSLSFQIENPFRGYILTLEESSTSILVGDIVILPKYRNQGLGTKLIKKVLNTAYKLGYEKAFLAVTDTNPAKQLYEKIGFKLIDKTSFLIVN